MSDALEDHKGSASIGSSLISASPMTLLLMLKRKKLLILLPVWILP